MKFIRLTEVYETGDKHKIFHTVLIPLGNIKYIEEVGVPPKAEPEVIKRHANTLILTKTGEPIWIVQDIDQVEYRLREEARSDPGRED